MCNRRSRGVSLIRGKSRALRLTRLMFSWIIWSPWSVDQSWTLTNTSLLLSPLKDQNREWGRGRGSCGWGRGGRRGHGCLQVKTLHHAFRLHYGFFQGIEEGSEPESDRSAAAEARHIKASGENFRWVVTWCWNPWYFHYCWWARWSSMCFCLRSWLRRKSHWRKKFPACGTSKMNVSEIISLIWSILPHICWGWFCAKYWVLCALCWVWFCVKYWVLRENSAAWLYPSAPSKPNTYSGT